MNENEFPRVVNQPVINDGFITIVLKLSKSNLLAMLEKGEPVVLTIGQEDVAQTLLEDKQLTFLCQHIGGLNLSSRAHNGLMPEMESRYTWEIPIVLLKNKPSGFGRMRNFGSASAGEIIRQFETVGLDLWNVPANLIEQAKALTAGKE